MDTTTAGVRLVFHVVGVIAEFELALIIERTSVDGVQPSSPTS